MDYVHGSYTPMGGSKPQLCCRAWRLGDWQSECTIVRIDLGMGQVRL